MIYSRLTKEQLEELHPEFTRFLASQSIDKTEWENLKIHKPEVAEQEIDIFSDLVWEGVLQKAQYAENYAPNTLILLQFLEHTMNALILKVQNPEINLETTQGLQWLQENLNNPSVEIYTGSKTYQPNRNQAIFQLLQQGAILTQGQLYQAFQQQLTIGN